MALINSQLNILSYATKITINCFGKKWSTLLNYLMSSSQSALQGQINIAEHYGTRYRIKYGAEKTKITVIGSDIDMKYFQDTTPWSMGGQSIKVVDDTKDILEDIPNEGEDIIENYLDDVIEL